MKQSIKTLLTTGVLALGFASALQAQASVVIAGTRVIYNAGDTEQTIKLTNDGKSPALTQAWLDKGDPKAAPSAIDVPFTITPPFARVDPGKGQTLRILYTGEPLPQDKESVFWLNVLEIPPKATANEADVNKLQMAFRSRIKMFFRPAGLKGNAGEAPAQISWRVVKTDNRAALEAYNPTPYHVSFATLELTGGGKTAKFEDGGMVGPGETRDFPLSGEVFQGADAKVRYHAINDYGGPTKGESMLNAAPQTK
ncbi:fimbria/pilus periplasmic chaperone [Paraburkholderia sp. HP33-1]|uniref:fimbria/pilus periplasmic chaperone n=1 Tax=Paraburkholderia sp. HP33-1 TaxID=2883243 RepID=UPI001F3A3010|nr:fimbria/pilus periplasmic chaperone [Paraburkholderia sp. HP33-1]